MRVTYDSQDTVSADGLRILDIFPTRLQAGHESEHHVNKRNHFIHGYSLL
ncbi:hypothetical protein J7E20_10015 [Bacillus sp. ISL-26]|nr:hypothetical protein [Bacillus sp. ISL-26]MBT2634897.1 hypothetical protein [Bacillus sp. ISL-26]